MAFCPNCGRKIDKGAKFCKYCRINLETKEWNAEEVLYYYGSLWKPSSKE